MICRNCGSNSVFFRRVYNDVRWGEHLTYNKCLHCLVEFHTALPDPIEWYASGEYRDRADISEERAQRITSGRCRAQIKWMDKHWRDWRGEIDTILDIGAYQGIAVGELRSQGFNAVGYEPDSNSASYSEFVTSEISDTENFDMLWMSHVLEHVGSAIDMLELWKPYSRRAFVEIPPGNYQLPHILVFNMDSFLRLFELADMRVTKIDGGIHAIVEW